MTMKFGPVESKPAHDLRLGDRLLTAPIEEVIEEHNAVLVGIPGGTTVLARDRMVHVVREIEE